jgi:trehalose 6-phosphate synthase
VHSRRRDQSGGGAISRLLRENRILRNPLVRYAALAFAAALIMVIALAPVASILVEGWSQRDIELRARLVFRSIRDQVTAGIVAKPDFDLIPFFERLTEDERILALGFCTDREQLRYATRLMPKHVTCEKLKRENKADTFTTIRADGRHIHITAFPMTAGALTGHLLVLHDLAYIDDRAREAHLYAILALMGVAAGLGLFWH